MEDESKIIENMAAILREKARKPVEKVFDYGTSLKIMVP